MDRITAPDTGLQLDMADVVIDLSPMLSRLLGVAFAAFVLTWVVRRAIGRVEDVRARRQLMFFAPKLIRLIATLVALETVGIDVSGMAALLATIGVTGAIVFTPVGQNIVSGSMTTMDDLYRVGEIVTVDEMFGRVSAKSVLRTELELPDGSKAWIPNSRFQDADIMNHSRMGGYRIHVDVPLDGEPDRRLAVRTMERVLEELSWNSPGKRPFLLFDHVGGDAIFYRAFAWIPDRTEEPRYCSRLLTELVDVLDEVGVSVGQTTNISTSQFVMSSVEADRRRCDVGGGVPHCHHRTTAQR